MSEKGRQPIASVQKKPKEVYKGQWSITTTLATVQKITVKRTLDHLQGTPRTRYNKIRQKPSPYPPSMLLTVQKAAMMTKGRKNFRKDKRITIKNMSRGKVPRLCYIKAKKGFISLILTHTLIFSDTQCQHTNKKGGLSSSSTSRHLFKELVSSYLYKKYKQLT